MLQFWVAKKKHVFLVLLFEAVQFWVAKKKRDCFSCEHLDAFGPTVGEFAGPNLRLRRG